VAEDETASDDGVSLEDYERLVELAAQRRRGIPCPELEEAIRADPAVAELVQNEDFVAEHVCLCLESLAPTPEQRAAAEVRFRAAAERLLRRRRRLRWAGGLAVAATLLIAVPRVWPRAVIGRATVRNLGDAADARAFEIRAGQNVVANAGTKIQIDLAGGGELGLQPTASVSVENGRIVLHDGTVHGRSGLLPLRIEFGERSLELGPDTLFTLEWSEKRAMVWTNHEAKLRHGAQQRVLPAGATTTLTLGEPDAP
jgi:hypothetical protein